MQLTDEQRSELKAARLAQRIPLRLIAIRLGVNHTTVMRMENGQHKRVSPVVLNAWRRVIRTYRRTKES